MPQRKSAKKELKKNLIRREKNLAVKNQIKSAIKKFKKSLESKDQNSMRINLRDLYRILDKAASKGIIHANKAARRKSRLSARANATTQKSPSPKKKQKASL
ncbi:MAG: 30S ribosomal protein S20 [Candidatus Omnitrophota bacterium]|nr:MAG: 30S ribosomal protein S20 [Candidatus Omnitrophota bacterium]